MDARIIPGIMLLGGLAYLFGDKLGIPSPATVGLVLIAGAVGALLSR